MILAGLPKLVKAVATGYPQSGELDERWHLELL